MAGVFSEGKFSPTAFVWSGTKWHIQEITSKVLERDGGVPRCYYSVVAKTDQRTQVFRLLFQKWAETWWIEEVWDEPLAAY